MGFGADDSNAIAMRLVNKPLELWFGEATAQSIEERSQGAVATRGASVWFNHCAASAWGEYPGDLERAMGIEPTSVAWEAIEYSIYDQSLSQHSHSANLAAAMAFAPRLAALQ